MVLLAAVWALLASPGRADEQLYTCSMHPQIIRKEPGNCPICGMPLTPIRANRNGRAAAAGPRKIRYYKSSMIPGEISPKPGKDSMGMDFIPVYDDEAAPTPTIEIDPATIQRMNLKTARVMRGPVIREMRTVGTVAYDEAGLRDVTTKYAGWIERLYVGATWSAVRAGEPLFEIYSPDLYNAEMNFLVAWRAEGGGGGPLTRVARARLELFDLSADYIADLAKTGQARRTYVYPAPAAGMVIEKMAVAGQMMQPGERIYRLADLAKVWVLAQVFEQDLAFVHPGGEATVRVTYGPERIFNGRVESLLPQVEEQTRTATARIILGNADGYLRPGMFVDVRFAAEIADAAVLVPDLAVLRSGEHNTVFLSLGDGGFEPREVKLGARSQGNYYQVLSGLSGGETVVTSGQFMLDSESQLRDAIQKMLKAAGAPEPTAGKAPAAAVSGSGVSAAVGMDESSELPGPARSLLRDLGSATIDAAEALAADNLSAYRAAVPKVRQALGAFRDGYDRAAQGPLGQFAGGLPDRTDLKAARRDFASFSTVVTDLVRENHLAPEAGWHVFECPMAPGIGTGRWLADSAELRNPFYGSAMLECGEEIDAPAAAGLSRD